MPFEVSGLRRRCLVEGKYSPNHALLIARSCSSLSSLANPEPGLTAAHKKAPDHSGAWKERREAFLEEAISTASNVPASIVPG
jgi:hypothetical protein